MKPIIFIILLINKQPLTNEAKTQLTTCTLYNEKKEEQPYLLQKLLNCTIKLGITTKELEALK